MTDPIPSHEPLMYREEYSDDKSMGEIITIDRSEYIQIDSSRDSLVVVWSTEASPDHFFTSTAEHLGSDFSPGYAGGYLSIKEGELKGFFAEGRAQEVIDYIKEHQDNIAYARIELVDGTRLSWRSNEYRLRTSDIAYHEIGVDFKPSVTNLTVQQTVLLAATEQIKTLGNDAFARSKLVSV